MTRSSNDHTRMLRGRYSQALLAMLLLAVSGIVLPVRAAESDDATVPDLTPRQQAVADRMQTIASERTRSSDLRLRIIYSMNGDLETERRPEDNGLYGKELISAADLYEQARGATDPLTLDLLMMRCSIRTKTEGRCDRLALAHRWTESDTQNQVAWLVLAATFREAKDDDAGRAAFMRAALASRWHGHHYDIARLVAQAIPRDLPIQEHYTALLEAFAKAGMNNELNALHVLWVYCKEGGDMRSACARIVETMARDTDNALVMSFAVRYAVKAGVDATTVVAYQQRIDALNGMSEIIYGTDGLWEDIDDPRASANIARAEALLAVGERRRAEQVLMEQHVTEDEAARRFVATLSADQLKRRAEILAGR